MKIGSPKREACVKLICRSTVAAPVLALLVIAVVLGFFVLYIDSLLLQIAPLDAWPMTAQVMHWGSPWVAVGSGFTAVGLASGWIDGALFNYFTHRHTVIVFLVLALVVVCLSAWAVLPLAIQLAGGRI